MGQKWELFKDKRKQDVYIVELVENIKRKAGRTGRPN